MNILKSAIVIVGFLVAIALCFRLVFCCVFAHRSGCLNNRVVKGTVIMCIVTITLIVCFGKYTWPFEYYLKPKLIATIAIPSEYTMEKPGCTFWRAAYDKYGLYSGSRYFNPNNPPRHYGIKEWPEMDLKKYTYIITYGQKINSLSYNVWDTIDTPIRTGAYAGHMLLAEEFDANSIYIYQIPKMRIDNNL